MTNEPVSAEPCCRICHAPLRHTFVDLGMSPLCESFVPADKIDAMEPFYPLHVMVCDQCFLVQLREYVSPESIFDDYAYFSSYSTSWVAHAKTYCEMIAARLGLGADSQVVEIASNDGYLLQHFGPLGIPVHGVEPSGNVAEVAIEKGIPTTVDFFGQGLARQLVEDGRAADLIVANNVLAHVPDINDFVAGLKILLKPEGIATLEFPHLERLMAENQFDTIYHEHFSYLSALVIERLAKMHGLAFVDVEELPSHGGSLRIYLAQAGSSHVRSPRVDELIARERKLGFDNLAGYVGFSDKVERTKRELLSFLIAAKNEGKRICGYGAPGKGNTLLNYCGIGPDFLDFTVDRNPYKHGRFTPGTHIPIRPVEAIDEAKPDLILILPWNLTKEIVSQMKHVADWGAKFVIPIPAAHVIDPAALPESSTAESGTSSERPAASAVANG
ncbi:methyltransferase, putative [Methyloceanibacter caenitepidi]|uniref:Methyltransferase, putative n=1 Tax=Methyloceanibacter caenitepidi TaxID=1384459 RepID=A0A0A8JZ32_9HYPH|nr:methyltransferase, putative [Methyloceanibacter caenitepidi]